MAESARGDPIKMGSPLTRQAKLGRMQDDHSQITLRNQAEWVHRRSLESEVVTSKLPGSADVKLCVATGPDIVPVGNQVTIRN